MIRGLAALRTLAASTVLVALLTGTAWAQQAENLIIVHDIVIGHENNTRENTCVLTNRFRHEQQVVWRIKVIDPLTGEEMGDDALQSVEIMMPDGQVFEAEFGPHPARDPVDDYWSFDWMVPPDYPTGIVNYTIEAVTNDGRTGEMVVFPIPASMLTIIEE
jgi:hypothetical protein